MKKILLVVASAMLIPSIGFASIDQNLKYGQKNTEVSELQDFLVDKGYMNTSTGFFGLITLKAVQKYQSDNGIPSTGYVGTLTRAKVNAELDIEISASNQAEKSETGTNAAIVCGVGDVFNTSTGARCDGIDISKQVEQLQNQVADLKQTIQNQTTSTLPITNPPTFVFGSPQICPKITTGSIDYSTGNPQIYPPLTLVPLTVSGDYYSVLLQFSTKSPDSGYQYIKGSPIPPLFGIRNLSTSTQMFNYVVTFSDQSGSVLLKNTGSMEVPGRCDSIN